MGNDILPITFLILFKYQEIGNANISDREPKQERQSLYILGHCQQLYCKDPTCPGQGQSIREEAWEDSSLPWRGFRPFTGALPFLGGLRPLTFLSQVLSGCRSHGPTCSCTRRCRTFCLQSGRHICWLAYDPSYWINSAFLTELFVGSRG